MKTKNALASFTLSLLTSFSLYAQFDAIDSKGGGGGDASEARVDEIRSDILSWIEKGGAKGLTFPAGTDLNDYTTKMSPFLKPKVVVVNFVEKDHETIQELQVMVDGKPKTCRGFFSKEGAVPNILCNIDRFAKTAPSEQYKLIHHEFAGLAYLEKNEGSASDYSISAQITDYLVEVKVLKLAIKPKKTQVTKVDVNCGFDFHISKKEWPEFEQVMIEKGYFRASRKKAALSISTLSVHFNDEMASASLNHIKSNYKKDVYGFGRPEILDPKRAELNLKLSQPNSFNEYTRIQKEISETHFNDIPAISALVDFKRNLPSCIEFYGSNPIMLQKN